MNRAALGFRLHSGWTALVVVALRGNFPLVLGRARPHLVNSFTAEFRQPYHTAKKLALEDAPAFVERVRGEAQDLASEAIDSIAAGLLKQSMNVKACGLLLGSGRPLPAFPKILASHALIHTAEGELFRAAVFEAAKSRGIKTLTIKESEVMATASEILRLKPEQIAERLAQTGRSLGSPWTQDEKLATLAAALSLLT